jgi:hypothetical protein
MTKTFNDQILFGFLKFGPWCLFVIWDLIFGISINQGTSKQANSLCGIIKI